MKTDDVCARYADRSVGLTVKLIEADEPDESSTVLVEGKPEALRMLAELLLAVADEPGDGFSISPDGAGSVHFSSQATLGVYLRRL
jgi:hypothetical protein